MPTLQAESFGAAGMDLISSMQAARGATDALLADATFKVRERVAVNGRTDTRLVEREQRATHGLAWFATYAEAIRQLTSYAERMSRDGRLGEIEELLVRIGAGVPIFHSAASGVSVARSWRSPMRADLPRRSRR